MPSDSLYCANLSVDVTEDELRTHFSKYLTHHTPHTTHHTPHLKTSPHAWLAPQVRQREGGAALPPPTLFDSGGMAAVDDCNRPSVLFLE